MTESEFRRDVLPLKNAMYGMAIRMGIPPDDAADVVQETLIRLWRFNAGIPESASEIRLYCMTALRNGCLDSLKRRRQHADVEECLAMKAPPERDAEYDDTRARIEVLIDTLPRGQAQAVRLSSFAGLDNAEIASTTGLSEANVRQLLSRGRKRLRELFRELYN